MLVLVLPVGSAADGQAAISRAPKQTPLHTRFGGLHLQVQACGSISWPLHQATGTNVDFPFGKQGGRQVSWTSQTAIRPFDM